MKITAEYELYIERRWEADQARYQWERKAMLRGLGWGTLFSAAIWTLIYLGGSWLWRVM